MHIRTLHNVVIMDCLASSLPLFLILGALTLYQIIIDIFSERADVLTKIATYITVRIS